MTSFYKTGLIVCLSVSSLLAACGDDDSSTTEKDASTSHDGGTSPLDSGLHSIDSGVPGADASTPVDAATPPDSSTLAPTVYNVTLTKAQETAVCPAAGTAAAGTAVVTVSADDSTITVAVAYSGLSGDAIAGHIHSGAEGVAGPVVLPFSAPFSSPFTKTLTAAGYSVKPGAPATFAEFVTALKAGSSYVNLHTTACGDGEIRGQIK